jgi:hypothetical protein
MIGGERGERGAVLIIVLLVMITLLSLGMVSLWLTSGNLRVSGSMSLRSQTLYCAEAGIERARAFLNTAPAADTAAWLTTLLPGGSHSMNDVPSAVDAQGKPNGVGAVLADATGALTNVAYPPPSFGRVVGSAEAPQVTQMGSYTVWIRNDITDLRDGNFLVDTNSSVVIRSQCVAPDGRTNTVLEATFVPPVAPPTINLISECLDSGKNVDDANTNTLHCSRGN